MHAQFIILWTGSFYLYVQLLNVSDAWVFFFFLLIRNFIFFPLQTYDKCSPLLLCHLNFASQFSTNIHFIDRKGNIQLTNTLSGIKIETFSRSFRFQTILTQLENPEFSNKRGKFWFILQIVYERQCYVFTIILFKELTCNNCYNNKTRKMLFCRF